MLSLLNTTFTNAVRGGVSLVSKILSKLTSRADVIESEDCVKEALRGSTARNASFALIPSAYSDGVVHAALPDDGSGDLDFSRVNPAGGTRINSQGVIEKVSLLGDELVTNGTFETFLGNELITNGGFEDGSSGWTITTGWSIEDDGSGNNVFTNDGSANNESFQILSNISVGDKVQITYDLDITSGSVYARAGYGDSDFTIRTLSGTYTEIHTFSGSTALGLKPTNFIGSIDNI
jgi:hypothetical protein